jgi:hypothetical protein
VGVRRARRIQRTLVVAVLGVLALLELRKPRAERTWEGRVLGIPYSLRPPTPGRIKARLWRPEGPLFSPKVFGLGWDLNLGRLVELVRRRLWPGRS